MAKIKFRFATECELTLSGDSYEEVYLQFKDLLHEKNVIDAKGDLRVFPPEESTVFFEVDNETEFHQIDSLKGDFKQDILDNCPSNIADMISSEYHH